MILLPQPPESAVIKGIFHTIMADLRLASIDSLLHSANMKCLLFAGRCIEYQDVAVIFGCPVTTEAQYSVAAMAYLCVNLMYLLILQMRT